MRTSIGKLGLFIIPPLVLWSIAPLYLFISIPLHMLAIAIMVLAINISIFWYFNLWLHNKSGTKWTKTLISYAATLLFQLLLTVIPLSGQHSISAPSLIIYTIISVPAINTVLLILLRYEALQKQKEKAEYELQNQRILNLEAQKQTLLQQLHPHFIFNALSTLKSLIRISPNDAGEYTVRLSEFLRYTIRSNQEDIVTLEQELQFGIDYLELQKMRFGQSLQYTIQIDDMKYKIPVFAIQTLLENAIKHNAFTIQDPLSIQIVQEKEQLMILNNRRPKVLQISGGTGLANLSRRYGLLTGKSITILAEESYYSVSIPLILP
jgi:LytS/YehU family sensor histidine kinase